MEIDITKVDNLVVEGVDTGDYPDFCDAFIASGDYIDRELTDDECEWITVNYPEIVAELAFEKYI